jgi:hypothetical protein
MSGVDASRNYIGTSASIVAFGGPWPRTGTRASDSTSPAGLQFEAQSAASGRLWGPMQQFRRSRARLRRQLRTGRQPSTGGTIRRVSDARNRQLAKCVLNFVQKVGRTGEPSLVNLRQPVSKQSRSGRKPSKMQAKHDRCGWLKTTPALADRVRATSRNPCKFAYCVLLVVERSRENLANCAIFQNSASSGTAPRCPSAQRVHAPKGRRQRESVLSLLRASTSGVGSKLAGEVGILTAVSCEILIVSRFVAKSLASAVSASDSGSVGPRHQDISFSTGFMASF